MTPAFCPIGFMPPCVAPPGGRPGPVWSERRHGRHGCQLPVRRSFHVSCPGLSRDGGELTMRAPPVRRRAARGGRPAGRPGRRHRRFIGLTRMALLGRLGFTPVPAVDHVRERRLAQPSPRSPAGRISHPPGDPEITAACPGAQQCLCRHWTPELYPRAPSCASRATGRNVS